MIEHATPPRPRPGYHRPPDSGLGSPTSPETSSWTSTSAPHEKTLADVWAEVLGVAAPGIDDDFFDLGGHSLAAAKVVTRVRQRLGVRIGMPALFRAPTIAALAGELDHAEADRGPAPIPRRSGDDAPLSPGQGDIWLADCLDPGGAEYLILRALRLRGRLDAAALCAALDTVVARHEPLRSRFPERSGRPVVRGRRGDGHRDGAAGVDRADRSAA